MFALDQNLGERPVMRDAAKVLSSNEISVMGVNVAVSRLEAMQSPAVTVVWQTYPEGGVQRFEADSRVVRLILPVVEKGILHGDGADYIIRSGQAALVCTQKGVECSWSVGSSSIVFELKRGLLQERCFARYREARRVANQCHVIDHMDRDVGTGAAIISLLNQSKSRFDQDIEDELKIGEALADALVDQLRAAADMALFPCSGSVSRALAVLESASGFVDVDTLVRAAGITLPNLRRNVRECTGTTLVKLLQDSGLDRARLWLSSDREARSVEQIARACGFGRGESFVRAYRRRFGETPTQTRMRIFAPD